MTKTNIKTNLKSLRSILFIITLSLILIISGTLILNHIKQSNKQINLLTNSAIKTNTYQVIRVYYNDLDKSYYLHTTNLLDAPYCFDVILKDIQGDPSISILEDLNKAFTGSNISIKYDTKNTIDKYDDEILEYKFIDNTTYKQQGKIQNSILTIDNQYLNFIQTEEGELYKILSNKKLNNNQIVTLEINNDTGAVINLKEN